MGSGTTPATGWTVFDVVRSVCSVGVFLYVVLACDAAWGGGPESLAPAWLSAILIIFVAVLVHEFGHALAALACGHRVIVFAARPFAWHVHNRHLILMPKGYEAGLGGLVVSIPSRIEVATLRRRRAVVAGGPLASVLLAIAALAYAVPKVIAWASAPSFTSTGVEFALLAYALGIWSAWVTIVSLLPYGGGRVSDGQQLWALRHGWRLSDNLPGLLGAFGYYTVRLRDWPRWLIDALRDLSPSPETLRWVEQTEIGVVLDTVPVDIPKARQMLDAFRARHGDSEWLASCDAYFIAIWEGDWARAEARLWRDPPAGSDGALPAAAAAAVAARAGDRRTMITRLDDMERELHKRSPFADPTFRDIRRQIENAFAETRAGIAHALTA